MSLPEFLPALNLMTLVIVVLIAAIGLALFLRKRSNRHPMDTPRGREIEAKRAAEAGVAADSGLTKRKACVSPALSRAKAAFGPALEEKP